MRFVPLALVALALAAPAAAQRLPAPPASAEAAPRADPRMKSRSRAQLLALHSVVATGVGAALLSQGVESEWKGQLGYSLFSYGVIAAPSLGNLYAGDERRALQGIAIRAVGGALLTASLIGYALTTDIDDPDPPAVGLDRVNGTGAAIILVGAAYSIGTARLSVDEHNERVRTGPPLGVAPTVHAGRDGIGVGMHVRF